MNEIEKERLKIRKFANSGQYKKAYLLAKRLRSRYPSEFTFAYSEAVMFGDDEDGRTPSEILKRHKIAAKMLRPWLRKLKGASPERRGAFRNEYYWFSHQPLKQYRLGVEEVKAGINGYYSQGVGAVEMAFKYAKLGRSILAIRWAKRAEKAWLRYFERQKDWYNSYCWYAKSLGLQGQSNEMEKALGRAAKISSKSIHCEEFRSVRKEVLAALKQLKL